jgi:hypothetical protein
MVDIDKMSTDEWLHYRDELIETHLAKGYSLVPNRYCKTCDVDNDYVCFECECSQLEMSK